MKKNSRKILGILFIAFLAAATIFPVKGTAAESINTAIPKEENTVSSNVPTTSANGNIATPLTDVVNGTDSYDIFPPVIENFELKENGQTLTKNDTLHFKLSAYDADSGIESISVQINERNSHYSKSVSFSHSGENLYTATLPCSELGDIKGDFYVSAIWVTDKASNYSDFDIFSYEEQRYFYTFSLECEKEISISNFQIQKNSSHEDGYLRAGNTVTYSAHVDCGEDEIKSVSMHLKASTNGSWLFEYPNMTYNAETHTLTGTYTITDNTYPSTWDIAYICISTPSYNHYYFYPQQIEPDKNLKFTVVNDNYDCEKPIIKSITIDKNSQWVQAGDTITMTVKVVESNPSPNVYAYFAPQVSQVSSSQSINLKYHADTGEYIGTLSITEDTYPCEWALTALYVDDTYGNQSSLSDFDPYWYSTYPLYYKVKSNTYREDVKDVTFSFYGFAPQADGSFLFNSLISTQTVENVKRRSSLKELGISLPQPMEGINAKWQCNSYGAEINEDTIILFDSNFNTTCDLYATYDKGCANISLTYMTKDDGVKTATIPLFTSKESTYQEVLDSLKLPEDAWTENFLGYKLDAGYYGHMLVGDVSYFSVEAEYDSCQIAWHTRFLDWNGNETSNTISKSYPKGTRLSEALAALESPGTTADLEFEGWILTMPTKEDVLSQDMAELEVVATYRGKTTVDASYTYRREDGRLVSGHRLMAMNGENLTDTDMQQQASDAFKKISHLEGLSLHEWAVSTYTDLDRYREADFQALYSNCVAILKYPDGSCQYVVLDKGSLFTLPVENEKYTDILWKGFGAGESVTIIGDREFLVSSAIPRDETIQTPPDKKPTEQEINRILEEIEHSEAGATIHVDMKKATIIPKEILEAIQGKEINLSLHMEEYSWSIGGTNVLADNLKDTDLEVKIDADAIPGSLVDSITGGKPATQLSLTHNGEFGFRANLTFNLGSEYNGQIGNLYYYDSSGKLVFRNARGIGADGRISIPFSHASDYVVIIDTTSHEAGNESSNSDGSQNNNQNSENEIPDIDRKEGNATPNSSRTIDNSTNKPKSPKTGEK